jgi:hypothetical protein
MRLTPIIDELKKLRQFKSVRGVRSLMASDAVSGLLPQAFVVPESETATPNANMGAGHHRQRVDQFFGVVIVIGATNASAAAQEDELHELIEAVKLQLAGWTHPDSRRDSTDAGSAMDYVSGRLLAGRVSGQVQWLLRLRSRGYITKMS